MDKDAKLIGGIIIALLVGYFWLGSGGDSGVSVSSDTSVPYISTGATNLSFIGSNALQQGTAVSLTTQVSINDGAYSSTVSSASPGQNVDLLFTSTGYHSEFLENQVVKQVPKMTFEANLFQNASVTMSIFNTNGDSMYGTGDAESVQVNNQTVASGGAYNMKLRLNGQDKKSTNPMRCVLESANGTAMKTMTLSGNGATLIGKAKPSSYSLLSSTSEVWVYDIDAVKGATSPELTLGVQSETGMSLADIAGSAGKFKVSCHTKEQFVDTETGKVMFDIEDSQGASQSLAKYTFTGNFHS